MNDAPRRLRQQSILIVDDTPANLRLLVDALEQHGYAVAVAQDGGEALERAAFLLPDLILLDVMMPVMDGYDAARQLKAGAATGAIPIIFMSALSEVEDKLVGFAAGGTDYVTKPFDIAEVLARIDIQLALRAARDEAWLVTQRLQQEVEAHKQVERAYLESEQRYRTLVDLLPLAILVQVQERIAFANAAALRLLQASDNDSVAGTPLLSRVHEDSRQDLLLRLRQAGDTRTGTHQLPPLALHLLCLDGSQVMVEAIGAPIRYGAEAAVLLVLRDTTEQRQHEAALKHQASHDLLTGLPNRTLLMDRLEQSINRGRRARGRLALMFIDLDKFKYINDSLGHGAGDELLCTVAERLVQCVRECDTVARLGGDEFILLIDGLAEEDQLVGLAQRVVQALASPVTLAGHQHAVTCSIGISVFPQDGEESGLLLQRADIAMYRAKEIGRNTFQFFTPQMQSRIDDHLRLEKLLQRALEREEFVMHYQPQVCLQTGCVVGMEALVRWQSPEFGMLGPGSFIPFAEESELILALGAWVLNEVCRQLAAWRAQGLALVPVAINVSGSQFERNGIDIQVQGALQRHDLDPRLLVLELTESVSMRDPESSILWMRRLKEIGVGLAIDDFGTGYSNLSYLKRFPVDKLKIDQAFVRGLTTDPQDFAITTAVIRMARSLGLRAVAEGVETEGQMRLLAAESCDEMQGFYFRRPMPAAEMAQLLRQRPVMDMSSVRRAAYQRTVLIIDDEPSVRNLFTLSMPVGQVHLLTAASTAEAYEILANNEVGVIVSDQHLPEEDGVSFFARIKKMYPRTVRMLLTADDGTETLMNAINRGEIYRFIVKPWDIEQVTALVLEGLARYEN
jgi:diguanylate cyclase (GGDEF)-like protein/PAS domain S-box-containing protein